MGDVLPRALGFFLIPVYTQYLQPGDLGITSAMTTLGSILTVLFGFGIGGSLMRTYFDHEDLAQAHRHVGSAWVFLSATTLALTLLLILSGPVLAPRIYRGIPFYPYYVWMLAGTAANTLMLVPLTLLKIQERALTFAILNMIRSGSAMVLTIVFVTVLGWGAVGVLAAPALVSILVALPFMVWLGRAYLAWPGRGQIAELLRIGLPLVPHTLFGWVLSLSDRLFLERYHGLEAVGLYSLGYQMGLLMDYLLDAGTRALSPSLYRMATRRDRHAGPDPSGLNALVGGLVMTGALALALGGRDLLGLMITPKFAPALDMVPWVASAMGFRGFYLLAAQWIFYTKRTHILPVLSGMSALVNLGLNWVLIPPLGMTGAAAATLFSYAILFLLTYLYAQRIYPVNWHWERLLPLAGLYTVLLLAGARWLAPATWAGIAGSILAVGGFALAASTALRPAVKGLDWPEAGGRV